MIHTVGAAWHMASITGSPAMVALVQASVMMPIMLLSLITGALADSFDRRRMMIAAQSFMLVNSLALAICAALGVLSPWLLLAFTFLIGCGTAANTPAWQASVGDLVPRHELPSAIALNSMGFNIARSVGPAIGGMIVAAVGSATAFAVNTGSYIGLIAALTRWHPQRSTDPLPRQPLASAIAAGLRYTAMSPPLLAVLARGGMFGLAACSVLALLPLVARDLLGSGALTFGLLLGSFGAGAVAGAAVGAKLRARLKTEAVIRIACLAWVIGAVIVAVSRTLPLTLIALVPVGAGFLITLSTFNITVQLTSPRWVVARALSLYQMVTFGGMAAGSWVWGAVASRTDIGTALLVASAAQLLTILVGARVPLADGQGLNLDPVSRWHEPETNLPIERRSGPIVTSIEYRISQEDVDRFLALMVERRRNRLRNGVQKWTLLRDLADPETWIERYNSPTWLEYIRQNVRTTHTDHAISEEIRALHRGPGRPVVRRRLERQPAARSDHNPPSPAEE